MTKNDVLQQIKKRTWCSEALAGRVIDAFFDVVADSLSRGESAKFTGFGTFEAKKCAPRVGRNPHTGDSVRIPERMVPVFKPGKLLKDAVNKNAVSKEVKKK